MAGESLHMHIGFGDHHAMRERARNLNVTGVKRGHLGDPLRLVDANATGIIRRHGHGSQTQQLFHDRDIADLIRGGAAYAYHVDGKPLEE